VNSLILLWYCRDFLLIPLKGNSTKIFDLNVFTFLPFHDKMNNVYNFLFDYECFFALQRSKIFWDNILKISSAIFLIFFFFLGIELVLILT